MRFNTILLSLLASIPAASAFSGPIPHNSNQIQQLRIVNSIRENSRLQSTETGDAVEGKVEAVIKEGNDLVMPFTFNDMIKEASSAISDASAQGINRQIIRILLPRDPESGNLGQYFEDDVEVESKNTQNLLLAPPDESWQGGIMQLYRAAMPTCKEILRRIGGEVAGVPPKIVEDRGIDESGVDGVGLLMSQQNDPKDDVSCFVQPLQETVGAIESISAQAGDRLCIIMNPQWRNVDDALDSASKEDGLFGSLASFLGGKGSSLKRLQEANYKEVFTIEGYVCKVSHTNGGFTCIDFFERTSNILMK